MPFKTVIQAKLQIVSEVVHSIIVLVGTVAVTAVPTFTTLAIASVSSSPLSTSVLSRTALPIKPAVLVKDVVNSPNSLNDNSDPLIFSPFLSSNKHLLVQNTFVDLPVVLVGSSILQRAELVQLDKPDQEPPILLDSESAQSDQGPPSLLGSEVEPNIPILFDSEFDQSDQSDQSDQRSLDFSGFKQQLSKPLSKPLSKSNYGPGSGLSITATPFVPANRLVPIQTSFQATTAFSSLDNSGSSSALVNTNSLDSEIPEITNEELIRLFQSIVFTKLEKHPSTWYCYFKTNFARDYLLNVGLRRWVRYLVGPPNMIISVFPEGTVFTEGVPDKSVLYKIDAFCFFKFAVSYNCSRDSPIAEFNLFFEYMKCALGVPLVQIFKTIKEELQFNFFENL